ncbi:MAG: hypothetical protein EOP34_01655 [Rickettsiales bacterium]|nr:MAG: hypothetical protein EOP34_01655 [Rickettsiales bacterium]
MNFIVQIIHEITHYYLYIKKHYIRKSVLSRKPVFNNQKPVSNNQKPVSNNQKPVLSSFNPVLSMDLEGV